MNTITELIENGKIITPAQWIEMRTVCAGLNDAYGHEDNFYMEWDAMCDDCDSGAKLTERRDLEDAEKEEIVKKCLDMGMNPERIRIGYIHAEYPHSFAEQSGWNDEYVIVTTLRDKYPCAQMYNPDPDYPSQDFIFVIYA